MSTNLYNEPDAFVVLKISVQHNTSTDIQFQVLAGWLSGPFDSDYWRLNSGIVKVDSEPGYYLFRGITGSTYRCFKGSYGMNSCMLAALGKIESLYDVKDVSILEDCDWSNFALST